MNPWNPWQHMASRYPEVRVDASSVLPDGVNGQWDGDRCVVLDHRLTMTTAWCVLTHEIIHMERGWSPTSPEEAEAEEEMVRKLTACRLIMLTDLLGAIRVAGGARPDWRMLRVIPSILTTRLLLLSHFERGAVGRAVGGFGVCDRTQWWAPSWPVSAVRAAG